MSKIAILIVSGGKGERLGGGIPKQYRLLAGEPILRRTVRVFRGWPVQVVIGAGHEADYAAATVGLALPAPVTGGATRQESVRNGLEALAADSPNFVLIHDAARPLVTSALSERVIAALEAGADAAIPLLPVADTLRRENADGTWTAVSRDHVFRAQTPQGFRFTAILKAHRDFAAYDVTDDMALAERAGLRIVRVAGEETNMKITTGDDMAHAERLLAGAAEYRTGTGLDAHRFKEGDHVWLCGVKVPHDHGLEGHSDADAGLHALTDAILGAIGAGDIGQHFPPSDERWRGAASDKFLAHAASLVAEAGGTIIHCDVTLICERPKIGPHREAMRARIAQILGLDIGRVSVKATTTEGMGFTGRREGLAAQAAATVRMPA
ncbi:MAG: bifunctional 2-C-methyl-D-erythritol 4-phosphate cytidylyltransferase/2-C-methyl-D-erythritol 2,4-cyclodiphosphate synthase [Pseudomonadota bacterium]|nr:bifunctional 2-C-methyl-D-erythritol 4-phosphate cytidylyltransferase/2-C-methyl-D-erythritol 2,4-cyclodiphosphate synthase [Pseudomonadota bacterium]